VLVLRAEFCKFLAILRDDLHQIASLHRCSPCTSTHTLSLSLSLSLASITERMQQYFLHAIESQARNMLSSRWRPLKQPMRSPKRFQSSRDASIRTLSSTIARSSTMISSGYVRANYHATRCNRHWANITSAVQMSRATITHSLTMADSIDCCPFILNVDWLVDRSIGVDSDGLLCWRITS
jgi:hypothetical protein